MYTFKEVQYTNFIILCQIFLKEMMKKLYLSTRGAAVWAAHLWAINETDQKVVFCSAGKNAKKEIHQNVEPPII